MHERQAALLVLADRVLQALTIPREFHLPSQVRGTDPINPEGTDLYVWKYEQSGQGGQQYPFAVAFAGKANKPLWHHSFKTDAARDQAINREADNRRRILEDKRKKQDERRNFQHAFEVGDILYSSWGYDQTNIDFYQVTEVKGKEVVVREIGSRVVGSRGSPSEKVMAEPNEFVGPPMKKRPQGSGDRTYVKISDVQTAFEWDGRPLYQTGAGFGH